MPLSFGEWLRRNGGGSAYEYIKYLVLALREEKGSYTLHELWAEIRRQQERDKRLRHVNKRMVARAIHELKRAGRIRVRRVYWLE
ncbi:MAG: hypothetical protein DRJ96_08945 [Thermoprotei archaeon]|nr:MAG: hypothetical protein DRJ67_10090 [Thermoprotei archaeon]RLE95138.1 MAG: hypothetical protein DRJ96_08945 [Thermoprotei archaeon]